MIDTIDRATSYFIQKQLRKQIKEIWREIEIIRYDICIPESIKSIEIARLFEVQNDLETELCIQEETSFSTFLKELNLNEMDVKPMKEGYLKCHILSQIRPNKQNTQTRASSMGFIDNFPDPLYNVANSTVPLSRSRHSFYASDILYNRKREIQIELAILSQKNKLSNEETAHRKKLICELRKLNS
ncbi:hypothetical protein TRFO_27884 [Tritrichomonas foetus]|uniref:Uncharacterized protein n=1 Tax=Tritrichomonas foetus TaxID=1144522 RepID=A0A1J4JZG8_9EUKA|nr:hypothetical protein TRFO_27884 [Tritrichomonas foetus]|eukprot:OHT04567.1 hypothetical protein TRFO_27884 [Tritrichomonas foetus]